MGRLWPGQEIAVLFIGKLATSTQASQNVRVTSFAAVAPQGGLTAGVPSTPDLPRVSGAQSAGYSRERRILRVRAATFPRRMAASLIDLLLVTVVSSGVAVLAAWALGVRLPTAKELGADFVLAGLLDRNPMVAGGLGLFFGISGLYQIYLGGILGQTVGKRLLHIRLISSRGQAPGPVLASLRFLTMGLSLGLVGLGWLWCIFDRERRALHDHLSSSYVIVDDQ
jgi:uncharacterized RDD family membrane protein YckC